MRRAIGVDFGTTNSALALAVGTDAPPQLAHFERAGDTPTPTFRSLLYLERDAEDGQRIVARAGPSAIEAYLAADEPGRLMQSLKSFLANRDFSSTAVLGESYRLEALIGIILRQLREEAEAELGELPRRIVVGRPVRFASARDESDGELALSRLAAAFHNAGFEEVVFEYEPVAAAYHYERALDHDELILIGDFGGGTSDFSLLRVGPKSRAAGRESAILGNAGVAIAGDSFDAAIVRWVISPLLGKGTEYRTMFDQVLRVPAWIYRHLERWHHLSFLKSPQTLHILHDLCREGLKPERFEALLHLVKHDLGFELFRSVEGAKVALSEAREASLHFAHAPVVIDETVYRGDFTSWIWDDLESIASCVDDLLASSSVPPEDVDRVFLTGGSSFVPEIRAIFMRRFGRDKLRTGSELTSVASGLALRALEI